MRAGLLDSLTPAPEASPSRRTFLLGAAAFAGGTEARGYADAAAFYRAFAAWTGGGPRDYRRRFRGRE